MPDLASFVEHQNIHQSLRKRIALLPRMWIHSAKQNDMSVVLIQLIHRFRIDDVVVGVSFMPFQSDRS